jgi:arginine deiminase
MKLSVHSEIGNLKSVLLHRPSHEIENLTPALLERLLFDDIPYLKVAQEEHDAFAEILRNEGVEVLYLADMVATVLEDAAICKKFIHEFLSEADIKTSSRQDLLMNYLLSLKDKKTIVNKLISGIQKTEVDFKGKDLEDEVSRDYPFICDPLPNLYFTRDPFATIGCGISLNHMRTETRRRETLFSKYIFEYHPLFVEQEVPFWYRRENSTSIEGGDVLVLNEKTLCVGISQRTQAESIERLANRLFQSDMSHVETILAFHIPSSRAFMHLDTVFTQVDHSIFTVHGEIEGPLSVYKITKGNGGGALNIEKQVDTLEKILQPYCKTEVKLIRCGGGDKIISAREQWNDGSNTLAIRPGEVIVYARNYVTNQILEDNGIKVHVMPSSELSRGRGGPRCMSMPLIREKI